jgi:hypothetical protein
VVQKPKGGFVRDFLAQQKIARSGTKNMVQILYQQSAVQMEVPLKNSEIRAARICFGWPQNVFKTARIFFFLLAGENFFGPAKFFCARPAGLAGPARPAARGRGSEQILQRKRTLSM